MHGNKAQYSVMVEDSSCHSRCPDSRMPPVGTSRIARRIQNPRNSDTYVRLPAGARMALIAFNHLTMH